MESIQFQRIFNLAKTTGQKFIVFDSVSNQSFVILPLDEYESLIVDKKGDYLTEEGIVDKINNDIALWRDKQENNLEIPYIPQAEKKEDDIEEEYYLEPLDEEED